MDLLGTATVFGLLIANRIQSSAATAAATIRENITDLELLKAEIGDRSHMIDSFADGLDSAVLTCDARATVEYANQRAAELFRFPNMVGRSVLAITLSYDLEQLVLATARTGKSLSKEIVLSPNQDTILIAKAWTGTSPGRVFLSMYDVSNLRRLERVRQDFVANVSHELRTPMSVIRAYAETLLDEDEPDVETKNRYLGRMIQEVDRLSGITQDLLYLSAAESNPVQTEPCDIARVFQTVVNQLLDKASAKGIALTYKGADELVVSANGSQMTQVAVNLIDNAINYTTHGSVEVQVNPHGEGFAEILVKDTGIGISSDNASRIFERFYRVDKGRSRSTGGTGLGLSIVKHIVDAHRGTVSVESALNIGSTFRVVLPVLHEPLAEAQNDQ